jgi:hypothetical protein
MPRNPSPSPQAGVLSVRARPSRARRSVTDPDTRGPQATGAHTRLDGMEITSRERRDRGEGGPSGHASHLAISINTANLSSAGFGSIYRQWPRFG